MIAVRLLALCAVVLPLKAISAPQPEQDLSPPSRETMSAWAPSTYPALAGAESVPKNLYVGFVVNEQFQVLHHSAILRPGPRPMLQDIAAMFPSISVAGSPMGGIAEVPSLSGGASYHVIWVMVPSR